LEVERPVAGRLTIGPSSNTYPVWSPDGRTIVFASGSPRNLFRKESSGAGTEEQLTHSTNSQFPIDCARGGRLALYHATAPESGSDLWVVTVTAEGRLAPDAKPRPYLQTPFNERWGRFSPESPPRWVAYSSDETGRYEVCIQAFPEPLRKFQISIG